MTHIPDVLDPEVVAAIATELQRLGPMELVCRPLTVLRLAGLLQLALRHPDLTAEQREAGDVFLGGAREYFAASPVTLELLKAGDDPAQDLDADGRCRCNGRLPHRPDDPGRCVRRVGAN